MKILAIETAIGACSVALLDNEKILADQKSAEVNRQAELLPEMAKKILANLKYSELDRIAVNVGPGSFTGIRIGLAFAEGLALAHKIPLISVNSFEAISFGFPEDSVVVQEAMRGDCYFRKSADSEAVMIKWEDLQSYIPQKTFVLSTNPEKLPAGNWQIHPEPVFPSARNVGMISIKKSPVKPSPFYIRPPDARPQKTAIQA